MADVIVGSDGPAMSAEVSEKGFKVSTGGNSAAQDALEARKMLKEGSDADKTRSVGEHAGTDTMGSDAPDAVEGKGPGGGEEAKGEADGGDDFADLKQPETFDPEDPESLAAWDAEYLKDGDFNLERFQKEASKNMKDDGTTALDEKTYDYLKSKGIGKSVVDQIIADRLEALKAKELKQKDHDMEVFTAIHDLKLSKSADGATIFIDAIAWARKGNYSEAAQKRFDAIMTGTDLEAKKDAAELLVNKFARSADFQAAEEARAKASRKREPTRDATNVRGAPSGGGVEPFASRQEWRAARREAGNNKEAQREVYKRAKASGFA